MVGSEVRRISSFSDAQAVTKEPTDDFEVTVLQNSEAWGGGFEIGFTWSAIKDLGAPGYNASNLPLTLCTSNSGNITGSSLGLVTPPDGDDTDFNPSAVREGARVRCALDADSQPGKVGLKIWVDGELKRCRYLVCERALPAAACCRGVLGVYGTTKSLRLESTQLHGTDEMAVPVAEEVHDGAGTAEPEAAMAVAAAAPAAPPSAAAAIAVEQLGARLMGAAILGSEGVGGGDGSSSSSSSSSDDEDS